MNRRDAILALYKRYKKDTPATEEVVDRTKYPHLVDRVICTADFVKFKGAVIALPGYSKRKCINEGVLHLFSTKGHWPTDMGKSIPLTELHQ